MTKRYINPKREGRFSKMYEWLEREPKLSLGAKMVYARLARYASDKAGRGWIAYPRQSTLSDSLAIPERTCRDYIAELIEFGLVESHQRGLGKSNYYRFLEHAVMSGVGEDPLTEIPPEEQDELGPDQK
jgi:hypothetical protein